METLSLSGPVVIELVKYLEANGTFLFLSSNEIYGGSKSSSNTETDLGKVRFETQGPRTYTEKFSAKSPFCNKLTDFEFELQGSR